jgi:uncharacterized Zn finger protein
MDATKKVQAPCSSCVRKTAHEVLYETSRRYDDSVLEQEAFALLSCAGCGTISMGHQRRWGMTLSSFIIHLP